MRDNILINRSPVYGKIEAYPSKSHIQRALLLGLLSRNGILIRNYAESTDSAAMMSSIKALGASVEFIDGGIKVVGPGKFSMSGLNCAESGLCLRMLIPVLCLSDEEYVISGSVTLLSRSNEYIPDVIIQFGAECSLKKDGFHLKGPLRSAKVQIENPSSSQLISGLLYALSLTNGQSTIQIENPVSFPYIEMTAELLNNFGAEIEITEEKKISVKGERFFKSGEVIIEGDWSSSAFFLVAAAVSGSVEISGLDISSLQPDRAILDYLAIAGAIVEKKERTVKVKKADLRGFDADIKDHPDLFLPLIVLALNCEGRSRIFNYERLKFKESDRPSSVMNELLKAGAKISIEQDHIAIETSHLVYACLESYNDHRLAMAFAVAALNSKSGLEITGASCVNKSFPIFFSVLHSIIREN